MSATNELLSLGSAVKSEIEKVAEKHSVCPFELSLDTATWADIVVGDLNYVFAKKYGCQVLECKWDNTRIYSVWSNVKQIS